MFRKRANNVTNGKASTGSNFLPHHTMEFISIYFLYHTHSLHLCVCISSKITDDNYIWQKNYQRRELYHTQELQGFHLCNSNKAILYNGTIRFIHIYSTTRCEIIELGFLVGINFGCSNVIKTAEQKQIEIKKKINFVLKIECNSLSLIAVLWCKF